ncbi:MAG: hypothetical protein JW807_00985 [Spirochaetes bacterium]|nr:hypothetical protein [Spirochaetota bacterium]
MKTIDIFSIVIVLCSALFLSTGQNTAQEIMAPETLDGVTHYGMPIDEITKIYRKDDRSLQIVYSKTLSDDNMDDYVKRFYDELLRRIELWLYSNRLPDKNMKIVISNCKFCKIGYCKRKNIKEVSMTSYTGDKQFKQVSFPHIDIIDASKYVVIAGSVVVDLLEK